MKNLIPYDDDCFLVHKQAVNSKNNGETKERLMSLEMDIEVGYENYKNCFDDKKLELLTPNISFEPFKNELTSLYKYQSSVIVSVRESIRKLQPDTITTTCQNCSIDSTNTLDHILPKAIFPEFVVNPINLFPCCSTCNSYKLTSFNNGGGQKFLNLYLDSLPSEQYLFVDISLKNKDLDFCFYLENKNGINTDLYHAIESHFSGLRLPERMRLKAIEYISELETEINSFIEHLSIEKIVKVLIDSAEKNKINYGYNHWKYILEIELLNSPLFIDKYKKRDNN